MPMQVLNVLCPRSAELVRCGTGIEQSPRKRSARVVEAGVIQDASSGGWGDDESENSTPDVRSWFTKTSGR